MTDMFVMMAKLRQRYGNCGLLIIHWWFDTLWGLSKRRAVAPITNTNAYHMQKKSVRQKNCQLDVPQCRLYLSRCCFMGGTILLTHGWRPVIWTAWTAFDACVDSMLASQSNYGIQCFVEFPIPNSKRKLKWAAIWGCSFATVRPGGTSREFSLQLFHW